MSFVRSIAASYKNPGSVYRAMWAGGLQESQNLAMVMGASVAGFLSAWPELSRRSHLEQVDLNPLMGGALMGWLIIAPLMFYVLALVLFWIVKPLRKSVTSIQMRRIVFWSLIVAVPVLLLHGLVAGFIGAGVEKNIIGLVWLGVVIRTFFAGVRSV